MKKFNEVVLVIAFQFLGLSLPIHAIEGNQAEDNQFFDQIGSCLERDGAYLTKEPSEIEGDQLLSNCILENYSTITTDVPSFEYLMDFFGQCFDSNGETISFPLVGSELSSMFKVCYADMNSGAPNQEEEEHSGGDEQAMNFLHLVGSCLASTGSDLSSEPAEGDGDQMLSVCIESNYHIIEIDAPAKEDLYDFFGQCFDTHGDEILFPLIGEQLGSMFEGCYLDMRASEEHKY